LTVASFLALAMPLAHPASALTLVPTEQQAQQHCPRDVVYGSTCRAASGPPPSDRRWFANRVAFIEDAKKSTKNLVKDGARCPILPTPPG